MSFWSLQSVRHCILLIYLRLLCHRHWHHRLQQRLDLQFCQYIVSIKSYIVEVGHFEQYSARIRQWFNFIQQMFHIFLVVKDIPKVSMIESLDNFSIWVWLTRIIIIKYLTHLSCKDERIFLVCFTTCIDTNKIRLVYNVFLLSICIKPFAFT